MLNVSPNLVPFDLHDKPGPSRYEYAILGTALSRKSYLRLGEGSMMLLAIPWGNLMGGSAMRLKHNTIAL
jgi:hypothetical protein